MLQIRDKDKTDTNNKPTILARLNTTIAYINFRHKN